MNTENQNFFGIRLMLARKMAGMSLQELSDILQNIITKQALSKYEQGMMKPTSHILLAISKALDVKPDYFLKKGLLELGEISFRKRVSLSKKDKESIVEKARDYVERFLEIESILEVNSEFRNPIKNLKISNKEDVELAAGRLREAWELGNNPIPNIIEMLELRGIKIMLINDVDKLDGFAVFTSKGIPVVVINTKDKSIERIRFTTIHELAHSLLEFEDHIQEDDKLVEKLCHYFSSCFLIPSNKLFELIGGSHRSYVNIKELIAIKEYYGISIAAIIHRLKELGVINQNYYQRWVIYMSKTYGKKGEPGNYNGEEKVKIFEQLINRALAEGLISLSKAAVLLNTNIDKLRRGFADVN